MIVFAILAGLYLAGLITVTALEHRYLPPTPPQLSGLLFGKLPYVALPGESYVLYQLLITFGGTDVIATVSVGAYIVVVFVSLAKGVYAAQGSREAFEHWEGRVGWVTVGVLGLSVIIYLVV